MGFKIDEEKDLELAILVSCTLGGAAMAKAVLEAVTFINDESEIHNDWKRLKIMVKRSYTETDLERSVCEAVIREDYVHVITDDQDVVRLVLIGPSTGIGPIAASMDDLP